MSDSKNDIFNTMPVPKAYFSMTIPVVLSSLGGVIYNLADTYFISKTGSTNLVAGVSLCAPLMLIMVAFGDIFGIGGSSSITRFFGSKEDEKAKGTASFCFYCATFIGIVFALLMLLLKNPILTLLGVTTETYTYANDYYLFIVPYAPLCIMGVTFSNIIRAEGLVKENLFANIIGYVANIILDPIFIFNLNMGAAGAALATTISRLITVSIFAFVITTKSQKLSLSPKYLSFTDTEIVSILTIGIPASMVNILNSLITAITNKFLLLYGVNEVAAMGIASKINMITIMVMVGMAFGCQPLLGYNYGARNDERLKKILVFDIKAILTVTISCALILSIFSSQLMTLFLDDLTIQGLGKIMIRFLVASIPFAGICTVFVTLFQAEGKALPAFILTICRQGILFIIAIFLLHATFGYYGILATNLVADSLSAVLSIAIYKKIR